MREKMVLKFLVTRYAVSNICERRYLSFWLRGKQLVIYPREEGILVSGYAVTSE